MKAALLYLAVVVCLVMAGVQVAAFFFGPRLGFTRESWRTIAGVGHHRNDGAVISPNGLYFFFEREQHPEQSWLGRESPAWEGAGAPPQFTVSGSRPVHYFDLFGSEYQYSVRDVPEAWTGQYHLLVVHPLLVVAICGLMIFLAVRRMMRGRWFPEGSCPQCGYDLRGADHEKCPECGAAIAPVLTQ